MTYITKPEITYTNCPHCDVARPFLATPHDGSVTFVCLGCGDAYDDEGILIARPPSPRWRDQVIALAYLMFRNHHDQLKRYLS